MEEPMHNSHIFPFLSPYWSHLGHFISRAWSATALREICAFPAFFHRSFADLVGEAALLGGASEDTARCAGAVLEPAQPI